MAILIVIPIFLLFLSCNGLRLPFNKTLLNKKYQAKFVPCDYPRTNSHSLKINEWSLTYIPLIQGEDRGPAYTGSYFCQGEIKIYYADRPNHLRITKFPTATAPYEFGPNGPKPAPKCADIQPLQTVMPWGPTRQEYIKIFKEIFNGAVKIRDTPIWCRSQEEKPDEIISFLYAIAYDYFIDIQ